MSSFDVDNVTLRLEFEVEEPSLKEGANIYRGGIFILDFTSLLYDFELLHDLAVISSLPDYSEYKLSRFFWYRWGRDIKPNHKLKLKEISYSSPLILEILVGVSIAIPLLWVLVQAAEKISNWRLNRRKLRLEVEKLESEARQTGYKEYLLRVQVEKAIQRKELEESTRNSIVKRLGKNPLKLTQLSVETEEDKYFEQEKYFEAGNE